MCCTPEPKISVRKRAASVRRLCEALRISRSAPPSALDRPGSARCRRDRSRRRPAISRRRAATCRTAATSAFPRTCIDWEMWSTRVRPAPAGRSPRRLEVDVPEPRPARSCRRRNRAGCRRARARRNVQLARADALGERRSSSFTARSTVAAASSTRSADRADRGAVGDVEGMREPFLVAVHDDVDVALRQRVTALERCAPARAKPRPRSVVSNAAADASSIGELDELDAAAGRPRRQRGQPGDRRRPWPRRSSSSMKISERCPSTATLRAEPARKRSLNISSDSSPSNPVACERPHEVADRQARPAPACSGSGGSRRGSPCRAAARRPPAPGRCGRLGMARIAFRSVPRTRAWKVSSTSPMAGWSARRTTSHASR